MITKMKKDSKNMIKRIYPAIISIRMLVFTGCVILIGFFFACSSQPQIKDYPHPVKNPDSPVMLAGDWVPENPHQINFSGLPKIPSGHVVISDVRAQNGVNQHNYLVYYEGRYWIMWSDGPGVEDRVGQRVAFATSSDGLKWSKPKYITPYPPKSSPNTTIYNTRTDKGFRYISRGFWQRDGELLALVSLDEAGNFFGPGLELRAFRLDPENDSWEDIGVVYDNTINNFPPKLLPNGEWMMTRRTYDRNVYMLTGGTESFDKWETHPVVSYGESDLQAEEPYWWVLPDGNLLALFRDNARSGFLFRAFSADFGRTWSRPVKTDFPDARSKFNGLQLSDGRFVLVSNANPKKRDPLVLSISDDGLVFNKMGYLVGGRHVDYPHVMEHDGYLLVAFAGGKQTVEVLKIKISDLDKLEMPSEPLVDIPHPVSNPQSTVMLAGDWVPKDPNQIDFDNLPHVPSKHAVVSDVRDKGGKWVNQHGYLAFYKDRFWAMWSDGPGVQRTTPDKHRNVVPGHDRAGTRVSFATSPDGLNWSEIKDLSGPPADGFGWIARGFWEREGELLALASHFNAPGYTGKGLSLEAFRWDEDTNSWKPAGTVLDDALNNFPPKKLPNGKWMMSRRDHVRNVTVMSGGTAGIDQWQVLPIAMYVQGQQQPEEPYWYILPDRKNIVGLFRDNTDSKRLIRAFSTDNGQSWSELVRTNFPDARSKFYVVHTSRNYYALVSNANPRGRDPLTLAISRDGLIFTSLFYLVGGRHIDYPHMIEHDGSLYISFSGAKQTLEVLKVDLDDLDRLDMPSK